MRTIIKYIFEYKFSLLTLMIIFALCFIKMPQYSIETVPFMDKWTHMVMYFGFCSMLWLEYWINNRELFIKKILTLVVFMPLFIGLMIELLQKYATSYRSGEILDFVADLIGVVLAYPLGLYVTKKIVFYYRKKQNT